LPGGQVFITSALYDELETEGQLAGVLAHEIGHVVARHSAQQIAKAQLTEGLTGAVVVASYDPQNPNSSSAAYIAQIVGQIVNMKFGRDDELQSDRLGVRFMSESGYDPRSIVRVMEILAASSEGNRPGFFTHPNPDNRIARINKRFRDSSRRAGESYALLGGRSA
jgi:predicted Zn-dependent protease